MACLRPSNRIATLTAPEDNETVIKKRAYDTVTAWLNEHYPDEWVYREEFDQFQFIEPLTSPYNFVPASVMRIDTKVFEDARKQL